MQPDITLVRYKDRFFVVANTANGRAWKEKIMEAGDYSISGEFLSEYEIVAQTAGLEVEIK